MIKDFSTDTLFLKILSGPLCPKAPRPCPLTCHARACLTPCFVCTVVCRLSGWRVGAAGQSYINKADLGTLLGESEFKRRRGPFHSGSDTYEIRSHPVIALVCTLKVASVGVASVRRPSKFSVGETEAKKNHKPDKEQRKKERSCSVHSQGWCKACLLPPPPTTKALVIITCNLH